MEKVQMISRSLYIAGTADPISTLSKFLSINESHCFAETDQPGDYSFFAREENSMFYSPVAGDFQFAVDVNIFGIDWPELDSKLIDLSVHGLTVALPDEASIVPFDYILYKSGSKESVQIIEDDTTDRLQIRSRS
ncbi:hypothetical protein [Sorangium sp. So ce1153]|uniref:hypothetical protein n=1 Tax=Sorangium sp. So ce1153 TaxID=3133333 RepID=UPI003F62412B